MYGFILQICQDWNSKRNSDFVFTGLWFPKLAWPLVVKSFKSYYSQFQAFKVLIKNNKHIFFKSNKRFFRENGP